MDWKAVLSEQTVVHVPSNKPLNLGPPSEVNTLAASKQNVDSTVACTNPWMLHDLFVQIDAKKSDSFWMGRFQL